MKDPTPGEWMIVVSALEINQEGCLDMPGVDNQAYALVVSVDFDCNNNGVPDSEETNPVTVPWCPTGGGNNPPGNELPHNQMPPGPPGTGLE